MMDTLSERKREKNQTFISITFFFSIHVGGQRVMKISAKPGWKWSTDIKPLVGTESCQAKHVGVIVEGSITCRHDDGSEMTYSAGSAYSIEPGHDAWVNGDTSAVAYEFHGLWGEKG